MDTKIIVMAAKQNVSAAILLLADSGNLQLPKYLLGDLNEVEPMWAMMGHDARISWLSGFMSCLNIISNREDLSTREIDNLIGDDIFEQDQET